MGKKLLAIAITLTMMVTLFAGCSGGASSPASSSAAAPAQGSSDATSPAANPAPSSSVAAEPEVVLKLGHGLAETVVLHQAMLSYAEKVAERSNGRIRVDVYANAQLGNERDMVEGMQLGTVDIVYSATSIMANFVPACSIFDAPFLYRDSNHMFKVTDGEVGQKIADEIRTNQGLITLGFMDSGQRHIFSTKPVKTLDDFNGLKIRTMENELQIALFNTLGAQATPMAFGEVYTALQQGTIDAGEQPLQGITGSKFQEICKYVALTGHVYGANLFLMGEKAYEKVPEDLREMVLEEGMNACLLQRQLVAKENEKAIKMLEDAGVEITQMDQTALMEKVQPVYDQFSNLLPPDLVAEIAAVQ